MAAGRYTVSAWKSGYAPVTFGARTPWEPASVISLEAGQSASGLELSLEHGAAISGRVVDDAGDPVSDAQVRIGRAVPVNGRLQFQSVALAATTDDRGEYRVGGLPSGSFVVSAFGWVGSVTAVPGEIVPPRPRGTFYPRVSSVGQAQRITVRAGDDVRAIDVAFTAESLVTPTVSGRVVDPGGGPVQVVSVSVVSSGDGVPELQRGIYSASRSAGEFSFSLAPGDYTLVAQSADSIALLQVTVDRSDVTGLELVLAKAARMTGRIQFDGRSQRPAGGFAVTAVPSDQRGERSDLASPPARVRPDGSFTLTNLVGTVELRVMPVGRGWRPKSITAGGRNLLDVPVTFKGGEDLRDVQIVMTDLSAQLTGTIAGASPATFASGLSVLLFASDPLQLPRRASWVRPDQNGHFVVPDLSPGDYLAAVADQVDDLQWKTPAYLERFRAGATHVTLKDGETKAVTLPWTDQR